MWEEKVPINESQESCKILFIQQTFWGTHYTPDSLKGTGDTVMKKKSYCYLESCSVVWESINKQMIRTECGKSYDENKQRYCAEPGGGPSPDSC